MSKNISFARIYDNFSVGVESSEDGCTVLDFETIVNGITVSYAMSVPRSLCSEFELAQILRWVSDTLKKKILERRVLMSESQQLLPDKVLES